MQRLKVKNSIDLNNHKIFEYLKPDNNDKLSEISGIDLQEIFILLNDYYLNYRSNLGFEQSITFGMELEFEHANTDKIKSKLYDLFQSGSWNIKGDGSLTSGGEVNSPILKDTSSSWNELLKVCNLINRYASIGTHSGGHIHIGTQVLGKNIQSWLNFIKIWAVYENIIYRFVYGDFLTPRASMKQYARPLTRIFMEDYLVLKNSDYIDIEDILRRINHEKYQAVNFGHVSNTNSFEERNTIEFRCPNGTLEPIIWQNNVNLFVKLLKYSKENNFDNDILDRRYKENKSYYLSLDFYNEIYIQQALEFCDMIFTKNLDKIYFLRQYLKFFQIGSKDLEKSKNFIKKLSL